ALLANPLLGFRSCNDSLRSIDRNAILRSPTGRLTQTDLHSTVFGIQPDKRVHRPEEFPMLCGLKTQVNNGLKGAVVPGYRVCGESPYIEFASGPWRIESWESARMGRGSFWRKESLKTAPRRWSPRCSLQIRTTRCGSKTSPSQPMGAET